MAVKRCYMQQVHRECGGDLVLARSGQQVGVFCKRCRALWQLGIPWDWGVELPEEFMDAVPLRRRAEVENDMGRLSQ